MLNNIGFTSLNHQSQILNYRNPKEENSEDRSDITENKSEKPESYLRKYYEVLETKKHINKYQLEIMELKSKNPDANVGELLKQLGELYDYQNMLEEKIHQGIMEAFGE